MRAKFKDGEIELIAENPEEREALERLSKARLAVVSGSHHATDYMSVDLAIRNAFDHYELYSNLRDALKHGRYVLEALQVAYPGTEKCAG